MYRQNGIIMIAKIILKDRSKLSKSWKIKGLKEKNILDDNNIQDVVLILQLYTISMVNICIYWK